MSYDFELEQEQEFSPAAREFMRKRALGKQQTNDVDATAQAWLDYIDARISEHLDALEEMLLQVVAKKYELEDLQKKVAELERGNNELSRSISESA
jgi:hypothetical protein